MWFQNIDQHTEAIVRNCVTCQANTPVTRSEPLQMSELPETPWHSTSADFYGPLPTGEYLLVVIDEYTQYPIVEAVKSTSANTVIPVMDKVFSTFGILRVLKTDNGPPFNSDQFAQFATYLGFHHRKITPQWPQANATAERFMCTLGKSIRAAGMLNIPWKQHLNTFLREYRSTPHSTIDASPAELLFRRQIYKNSYSHNHYQQLRSHDQSKGSCCQKQDESLCQHSSSCHTKCFQPRRHSASPSAQA